MTRLQMCSRDAKGVGIPVGVYVTSRRRLQESSAKHVAAQRVAAKYVAAQQHHGVEAAWQRFRLVAA
jgi:hypothetical protein